jgi:dTDP-glucose 4,6-dehydratase
MKLLVTGGAGFIGSCFVRLALQTTSDIEIINVDKLTYAGNLENLAQASSSPRYRFVKTDICDQPKIEALLQEERPAAIVHFAAESHVDRSKEGWSRTEDLSSLDATRPCKPCSGS